MPQVINTGSGLINSLYVALTAFMSFLPSLLGAAVVVIVGWLLSSAVARLLESGLTRLGFERAVARTGINGMIAKSGSATTTSHIVAVLFKWMIRLIFIQAAANILGMPQVTAIINSIVLFIPKVAVALLIVVVGTLVAGILGKMAHGAVAQSAKLRGHPYNDGTPALFETLTRYAIIGFAFVAALSQLEIAPVIVNSLFIALIGSVALAVGLAFGLGARDVAGEMTRNWYERGKGAAPRLRDVSSKDASKTEVL